jgi:hypothetical protein
MKIELDVKDIIDAINEHHKNDTDVLYEFIDKGTSNWDCYRTLIHKMITELFRNGECMNEDTTKLLQSPPLQESEQTYPEEFVMWKDINTDFASDSNEYLYEYGENGESKWFTLPELLTYWKDNVQGKLMVDKFKMK